MIFRSTSLYHSRICHLRGLLSCCLSRALLTFKEYPALSVFCFFSADAGASPSPSRFDMLLEQIWPPWSPPPRHESRRWSYDLVGPCVTGSFHCQSHLAPARARSGLSMSESRSGHGGSTVSSERNGPGHWQVLLDGDANDQALRPPVPA